jgi:hypothetical protein
MLDFFIRLRRAIHGQLALAILDMIQVLAVRALSLLIAHVGFQVVGRVIGGSARR